MHFWFFEAGRAHSIRGVEELSGQGGKPRRVEYGALFEALPSAYVVLDRTLTIVAASNAYLAATGRERADIIGRPVFDAFPETPERMQRVRDAFERALAGEDNVVPMVPFAVRQGAGTGTRYWSLTHVPVRDGRGRVSHVLQHAQDVTGLLDPGEGEASNRALEGDVVRRAVRVEALSEALRAEGEHLKSMFRGAPGFMCVLAGPEFVFELANDAYLRMVGRADIIGKPFREALPELAGQGFFEMLEDIYRSGEPFHGHGHPVVLARTAGAPPDRIFVDFVWQPVRDAQGRVTSIFVQGSEVTDRVEALDRQRALLDEVNHRVKNTLTTVQAMVQQTLRNAPSPRAFADSLEARLMALSATLDLLTARNWSGVGLRDLVSRELGPYGSDRTAVRGPDLILSPRRATSMGLVFHELAANALKHGALSVPGGRVEVSWRVGDGCEPGVLVIDWIERGGPRVHEPSQKGLGSRIIDRTIANKPGASCTSTYLPDGLHWQARLPPETGGIR